MCLFKGRTLIWNEERFQLNAHTPLLPFYVIEVSDLRSPAIRATFPGAHASVDQVERYLLGWTGYVYAVADIILDNAILNNHPGHP
jgi:hypothetical protein